MTKIDPKIHKDIKRIIKRRLINVSPEILKEHFPSIVSAAPLTNYCWTDDFLLISFVDFNMGKKMKHFMDQGFGPFPCLITDKHNMASWRIAGMHLHQKNSCNKHGHAFFIEKDSAAIIQNLNIKINTIQLGKLDYTIDLAYIVSFGDKVTINNIDSYLDSLVAYSVRQWWTPPSDAYFE